MQIRDEDLRAGQAASPMQISAESDAEKERGEEEEEKNKESRECICDATCRGAPSCFPAIPTARFA